MPTMPGKITKGHILRKIDAWVNDGLPDDRSRAQHAREELENESSATLLDVLARLRPPLAFSYGEETHLRDDWLVGQKWWPRAQPVGPVLRRGLYEACRLVAEGKGFLDSHWICQDQDFEIFVTWNGRQVNLLVSTPPPPAGDRLPLDEREKILVVRRVMALGAETAGLGFDEDTGVLTERLHIEKQKKGGG